MKARLFGLALLCLGLLGALSLMAAQDAPPAAEPAFAYVQSAALPPQSPAAPPQAQGLCPDSDLSQGGTGLRPEATFGLPQTPETRLSYYQRAYCAFHLSDEAG